MVKVRSRLYFILLAGFFFTLLSPQLHTQEIPSIVPPAEFLQGGEEVLFPFLNLDVRQPQNGEEVALSVQLLLILGVLSLAPSIILLMTSFLRIAIVFDFVRRALSLQSVPPTQVLMGIALFLTIFIMWPTLDRVYTNAYEPMAREEIGVQEAYSRFESEMRVFMYRQMTNSPDSIRLFMRMSELPRPENLSQVPTHVLIPAFVLHEMTVSFKIGILLFIPFIIIDMVVSSVLMSMGMIMLPPVMISMPFKLILFVMVDGWTLLTQQLVASFL
ncbi:MAG: flagellar type III secretion system pore protein FliP [Spirochaetales bacterium]|nr:flagellar type III secretion system pore protein FliP [Spirochaetales bacterium]